MTNTERIQANNAELREAIEMAENLPDAGGEVVEVVIEPLSITENGTYEAPEGVDGFSPIIVNVPEKEPILQSKTVLPDTEIQVVMPDDGYDGLFDVTVEAMPTAAQAVPVIDVDANGLITATATQVGGYVEDGIERATQQMPTVGAKTITPTGSEQVAVGAGTFVTGDVKVAAVEADGGDDTAGALADRTITEFSSDACTRIAAYSFRGCANLETLIAPNAKSVGEYALHGCSKLLSIALPSVTTIDTNSFREASNLEVIDLPELAAIPTTAFYGCRALKALILRHETMVTLGGTSAFTQCYRLLGTKNPGYNPTGEKIGWVYVPSALLDTYLADSTWVSSGLLFRAIEDYPEICG